MTWFFPGRGRIKSHRRACGKGKENVFAGWLVVLWELQRKEVGPNLQRVAGGLKTGVLLELKASARNWSLAFSRMLKFLKRERSKFLVRSERTAVSVRPGPLGTLSAENPAKP